MMTRKEENKQKKKYVKKTRVTWERAVCTIGQEYKVVCAMIRHTHKSTCSSALLPYGVTNTLQKKKKPKKDKRRKRDHWSSVSLILVGTERPSNNGRKPWSQSSTRRSAYRCVNYSIIIPEMQQEVRGRGGMRGEGGKKCNVLAEFKHENKTPKENLSDREEGMSFSIRLH